MEALIGAVRVDQAGSQDLVQGAEQQQEELRSLLAGLAPGRLQGLGRIWDLCGDDLYNLALWRCGCASDAEDAVQDVFVRLASATKLGEVRRPRAYLLKMTRNAAVEVVKRRRRSEARPIEECPPLLVENSCLSSRIDGARVSALLGQLPAAQREVVFLRHFLGLGFREIGTVCRVPTFTAASRYRLAISRLRRLLGVQP